MELDLLLKGGAVVDGTGGASRRADLGVRGDRVVAIGDLRACHGAVEIDCTGKTITPGFIDIHSHSDWLLPGSDHGALVEPFVRQGMTSIVAGNCGFSPAPVTAVNRHAAQEASKLIIDDEIDLRWETMGEFLDHLERGGVTLNVAQLVGHGTIRSGVSGPLNPAAPTVDELRAMERFTRDALAAGCAGVSSGLGYPPGIFAQEEELTAFASWAAREGKIFTSHLKAYSWVSGAYATDAMSDPHNLAAIREILRVARGSGARLQISHLIFVGRATWDRCAEALALIDEARSGGIDVAFDAFPYTAGNTTASVLFPAWILPRLEEVLSDKTERENLKQFADVTFAALGFNLTHIQIMNAAVPAWNQYNGLFVDEAAAKVGLDPFDFYAKMVVDSNRNARVLIHTYSGHQGEEDALRAVLAHPLCTIETDTFVTREGHQNPASYGTFPRVLSTYVDAGLFSFEQAVYRMTGAAAERLGWKDRGVLREGAAADLVVLDRSSLRDTASFEDPSAFPSGIDHVFINGCHVLNGARYDAGARAGRVVRS